MEETKNGECKSGRYGGVGTDFKNIKKQLDAMNKYNLKCEKEKIRELEENKMETKNGECKSVQYVETVKANSFSGRYGGVGTDFKIYFDTIEDLKKGLDAILEGKRLMEMSTLGNAPLGVK